MNHFHIVWSIFTSIQIFSLIHSYHLSTTPATILSGAYFNTPRNFVQHFWFGGGFVVEIAIPEDFYFKKFVYIQDSPALCQPFSNKPHPRNFF